MKKVLVAMALTLGFTSFSQHGNDFQTKYVIQTGAIIFMLSMVCIKGLILLFRRNIRDFLIFLDD